MKFWRKLQKHGGSLSINLPKEWLRAQDLEAGDEIEMEDKNGTIIIQKGK